MRRLRRSVSLPLASAMALAVNLMPALAAQDTAADWPRFRGPGGLGVSPAKGLPVAWGPQENVAWKTELPGPGASSPIVVGERVFLTCYSGYGVQGQPGGSMDELKLHVVCLNANDGKIRWTKDIEPKLPEQANPREGHGYASHTPVADPERLYVFFGKSGVYAFDHGGKQLWAADVGSKTNGWGSAASPILAGDLVIVNASVESESLVALDRKTGKEVWRARGIRESWNTPILVSLANGNTELAVAIAGKVLGFDPASGEALWSCATDIGWYMVPGLVADKGIIYCIGGRSGVAALAVRAGGRGDVTASHRLWKGQKGSNVSSPIIHGGHLYWAHENTGTVYCAVAKTGDIVYEQKLERAGQFYPSPVLADGKLYYTNRGGRTYVLAAKPGFQLLATNEIEPRGAFNSSPAVAGRRLFLRSNRFLYCVESK